VSRATTSPTSPCFRSESPSFVKADPSRCAHHDAPLALGEASCLGTRSTSPRHVATTLTVLVVLNRSLLNLWPHHDESSTSTSAKEGRRRPSDHVIAGLGYGRENGGRRARGPDGGGRGVLFEELGPSLHACRAGRPCCSQSGDRGRFQRSLLVSWSGRVHLCLIRSIVQSGTLFICAANSR
jgi:hypothetical protein